MKEYELWLDESGDFEMESQASGRNPSLVGGILIPKGALSDSQIRLLADPEQNNSFHAVEMDYKTARRVVPPALEGICRAGGKLVYFENTERIDYHTNRELYLRVLSAGLAQLVKMLSVQGTFHLTIIVASRVVPDSQSGTLIPISPEEYRTELKSYIAGEFKDISFTLDPSCRIALTILSARQEARLSLADYACNARFVLDSEKYRPVRDRLLPLFDSRYHFTVTAFTSESLIRAKLSGGDVSGALMEYFTTNGKIDREKMLREIMLKLSSVSYRLQRLQIRKFSAELRSYAAKETDFERSEAILESAINVFFNALPEYNIASQYDESLFWIKLSIADMYLREGDVIHAAPVMENMQDLIQSMNYRAENLAMLYFFRDKKALYEINCMDYQAAVETMSETIRTIENLLGILDADELILEYYGSGGQIASEYLGDAYCMKIYAELFLQRADRSLYRDSLRSDSDRALSMYQYFGELERNQQYRSKIENEEGHCREALDWLLQTKSISVQDGDLVAACVEYLASAGSEDSLSRCYYAMYYIEIMENAARLKQNELADAMKTALEQEKQTLSDLLLPQKPLVIHSDVRERPVIYDDIFSDTVVRRYHPLEIVLWKYGSFLYRSASVKAAEQTWSLAVNVCDENPDYTVLKLVSVAILLERLSYLSSDDKNRRQISNDIMRRCEAVLKIQSLPPRMADYASTVLAAVKAPVTDSSPAALYALSRMIAF